MQVYELPSADDCTDRVFSELYSNPSLSAARITVELTYSGHRLPVEQSSAVTVVQIM